MQSTLRSSVNRTWGYIQDTTEFWTQYLKSQSVETANGIWTDTKPEVQEFLNDIRYFVLQNLRIFYDNR